jgi:2-oxoglutarate ferredoxin oxidoreductase subunit gamma
MTRKHQDPLSSQRIEIRLAGSGGQGLITAGLLLAEAAGVFDGREVAMVQSYGPEARGGASKAEIIISDSPIDYPLCTQLDLLLAMNQEASDAHSSDLRPAAWIIIDQDLVMHPPSPGAIALPFTAVAREKLKRVMVANVVALGAISELTDFVSRRALEKVLAARVPAGTEELNRKALNLGAKLVRDYYRKNNGKTISEVENGED